MLSQYMKELVIPVIAVTTNQQDKANQRNMMSQFMKELIIPVTAVTIKQQDKTN